MICRRNKKRQMAGGVAQHNCWAGAISRTIKDYSQKTTYQYLRDSVKEALENKPIYNSTNYIVDDGSVQFIIRIEPDDYPEATLNDYGTYSERKEVGCIDRDTGIMYGDYVSEDLTVRGKLDENDEFVGGKRAMKKLDKLKARCDEDDIEYRDNGDGTVTFYASVVSNRIWTMMISALNLQS